MKELIWEVTLITIGWSAGAFFVAWGFGIEITGWSLLGILTFLIVGRAWRSVRKKYG